MRRQLLAMIIAIVVGLVAIVTPLAYYHYYRQPTLPPGGLMWQSVALPDGLKMYLNITPSRTAQLDYIMINISIINPTAHAVTINAAQDWPINGVALGPCGTGGLPMGIAVYGGYYTGSNITAAGTPLAVFEPGVYDCISVYVRSFVFSPYGSSSTQRSDINGSFHVGSYSLSYHWVLSGFWVGQGTSSSPAVLEPFQPGPYTVVCANEWGQMVILHFNGGQPVSTPPFQQAE